MMAKRSTAQRLGRLLERVTKQSGRLPETPAYGSWLLGQGVGEPGPPAGAHPAHPDRVHRRCQCHRNRRCGAAGDRRVPRAEHLQRRAAVDLVCRHARVLRCGAGRRHIPDHPPNHRCSAMGDRRARPHSGRRARHLHRPVLAGVRRPDAVGSGHRAADDALWAGQQHVHSDRGVLRQRLRHSGVDRLLPVHRVRAASGGCSGARGRRSAAPIGSRDHGPDPDGVAARLWRSGAGHHRHRIVWAACCCTTSARRSSRSPSW